MPKYYAVIDKVLEPGDNPVIRRKVLRFFGIFGSYFKSWRSLSNKQYLIEQELNELSDKVLAKANELHEAKQLVKDTIKEINSGYDKVNMCTRKYTIEVSKKDRKFVPEERIDKPNIRYLDVFNPELFGKKYVPTFRERIRNHSEGGGSIVKVAEDTSKIQEMYNVRHAPGSNVDRIETYSSDQYKDSQKGRAQSGKSKHYKNKLKGESDSDYKARVAAIESEMK